jgi:segregation and condensation protein A
MATHDDPTTEDASPDDDNDSFRVVLDEYDGPLDLLLTLVRREEVDLTRLPVSRIADAYLGEVEKMQQAGHVDVDAVADFLSLAATLIELKSRLVLPSGESDSDEEEPILGPDDNLVRNLVEYKLFRDASDAFVEMEAEQSLRFGRGVTKSDREAKVDPEGLLREVDLWDLFRAFSDAARDTIITDAHTVTIDHRPISYYIAIIQERLASRDGGIDFRQIFGDDPVTREALVGYFIAMLELVRQRRIRVVQTERLGRIRLALADPPADGGVDPDKDMPR